jgi:dolichol-phosphate mannosyltransferase
MRIGPDTRRSAAAEVTISAVLPVYNEADVLRALVGHVTDAIADCGARPELVFVNDGSRDASAAVLDDLAASHDHVRVVHLSRNFGHQAAVQAGLSHSGGDVVVVMDADMQDDPYSIGSLLAKWREGYDVVYAVRYGRKENAVKVCLFNAFYRVLNAVSRTPMPVDAGNFGLIDRRVADALIGLPDRDRYFAGLRSWVGFRQVGVPVERGPRYDGQPRVSMRGLCRLAKSAIFSFSALPLSVFYLISSLSIGVFAVVCAFTLYHKLVTGAAIPGWTSVMMTGCLFGALNALGIAILGEYVVRIYDQVRGRPLYLVERTVNFPDSNSARGVASGRDAA